MSVDPRPIGVFDSGIGGLTVVRRLRAMLPDESIVYFGDSARVPYGTKSPETVLRFTREATRFLGRFDVKLMVVACNTASALALPSLRDETPLPMVGVIQPGVRAALRATRTKRIGVIGTSATIRSKAYEEAIHALEPKAVVATGACPLFVPLAEEGWTEGPVVEDIARVYLDPLQQAEIDTLVLGCTHYPLLEAAIAKVMGEEITLVEPAVETSTEVATVLAGLGLTAPAGRAGTARYFVSDIPAQFREVGNRFLGSPMDQVEWVDQNDLPWYER